MIGHRKKGAAPLLVGFLLALPLPADALTGHRPGSVVPSPVVPYDSIVTETGYSLTRTVEGREHTIGELLIRAGIWKSVEALFGINSYRVGGGTGSGKDDGYFGLTIMLLKPEGNGFIPGISLTGGGIIPAEEHALEKHGVQPDGTVALSWLPGTDHIVSINGRYRQIVTGDSVSRQFMGGCSIHLSTGDPVSFYGEYVSQAPEPGRSGISHGVLAGVIVTISPRMLLDASGGITLANGNDRYRVGGGAVIRFY